MAALASNLILTGPIFDTEDRFVISFPGVPVYNYDIRANVIHLKGRNYNEKI